jgi:hypothetical protein
MVSTTDFHNSTPDELQASTITLIGGHKILTKSCIFLHCYRKSGVLNKTVEKSCWDLTNKGKIYGVLKIEGNAGKLQMTFAHRSVSFSFSGGKQ